MKELLLVSRAVRGDMSALEQLIRLYYGKIFDYISFHVRDRAEAEDLTQEVFLKLVRSMPGYVPTGSFSAFLYRIARNCVIDYARKERPGAALPEDAAAEDRFPAVEARLTVEALLRRLPEEQRECVILYYIRGLKYREIAQVLEIPVSTAKSRVARGLAACKKIMEDAE